ncbi:peptide methionine sulfoxide reductase [Enterovibrio norvegicus FF-33]|uniref:peptide-methionine (S)-S-oxide reductase n=1 Tax=Enterovibrio norvegicus FF-454 TaxID=1185651 RepID=A0A1E5CBB1_9GAMM|nr:peptide-methionine (S)-S-oxide reductase [Enterovibrio norvegicus]OEE62788.1 peptide methionine sulfoxide reductase [Enterovibrio norvegicus FF-454]OEE70038.1 peptide methionine sulfoxide reductase [Enterovibrio norvegicus FF-33]
MYLAVSGTCYWCMEAVFSSLRGVSNVEQGFVASKQGKYVEAAFFAFDEKTVSLEDIARVHLSTHSCTSNHSAREKYPSAMYAIDKQQHAAVANAIAIAASDFDAPVMTSAKPFVAFYPNPSAVQNYFWRQPDKPFCDSKILPKLKTLAITFPRLVKPSAVQYLRETVYGAERA